MNEYQEIKINHGLWSIFWYGTKICRLIIYINYLYIFIYIHTHTHIYKLYMYNKIYIFWVLSSFIYLFLKILFILFLDRGEQKEKERERNISVWLLLVHPPLGTWPTTQACALTGNRTSDFGSQPALNPLSYTSQGQSVILLTYFG